MTARRTEATPLSLLPALRSHLWFASCPLPLQEGLINLSRLWHLEAGETLFARGGDHDGLCCVVAGALRVGSVSQHEGAQQMTAYLEPYQWFGEIALIDSLPRSQDAVADTDSTVLAVPKVLLEPWLNEHPQYWRDMARLACTKVRMMLMAMEDNATLPIEQQLARRLLYSATSYGHSATPKARRHLRLPQEYLARMLGVSRQTVNKALKSLASDHVIVVRYAEIEIIDMAGLMMRAGPVESPIWGGVHLPDASVPAVRDR